MEEFFTATGLPIKTDTHRRPRNDISGKKFHLLTAKRFVGVRENKKNISYYWECVCDCGNTTIVNRGDLGGVMESCGCVRTKAVIKRCTTHGMAPRGKKRSGEYRSWCAMITRCYNKNQFSYKYYGEKGVVVCDRWLNSFEDFYADVGARPSPKHTLDRFPNRKGNYEPGNVRWATIDEQNNNSSNVRFVTFNGETLSIAEWGRRLGINQNTIRDRLNGGHSIERSLFKGRLPDNKKRGKPTAPKGDKNGL